MESGLSGSVGTGLGPLASYALAAVVVLVLVVVVLVVAKRFVGAGPVGTGNRKGPRLAVLDVAAVDQRRKLVLVRRDEVEHLVLIGGQNDLVVEKGIVRTPQSLRQQTAERDGGRPGVALPRAPAIAPQPRPAASASPLRRPVPRPNFEPVPTTDGLPARQAPPPVEPVVSSAPELVEPKAEAPRPVLPPVVVQNEAPKTASPVIPRREEEPARAPVVESPVEEEATLLPEPRHPAPAPSPTPVVTEPRIPAFLRRGDPIAAPAVEPELQPEPEPVLPAELLPEPEPARRAPPRPFAFQSLPAVEPERPVADRVEPRTPPFVSPVFPTLKTLPPAEPVEVEDREFDSDEAPDVVPPAQRDLPPSVLPAEEAERRPLAVRSFATTIQNRRTNFESNRGGPGGERPLPPVQPAAPAPSIPSFLQPAPKPAPAPAPEPQDISLEETLSQKLNSDFGSVEWQEDRAEPVERVATSERATVDEPPASPAAAAAPAKPVERQLTLEEEMERLLSDFDFGERRR